MPEGFRRIMTDVQENLAAILRTKRAEALIAQAQIIRHYPDDSDRIEEAGKHIRETTLQRALGVITAEEEYRIFSILCFAMPKDAPADGDEPPSLPTLDD
jgi:hypothetical protein